MNEALRTWHKRQYQTLLSVKRDWAGTGLDDRLVADMGMSLARAVDIAFEASSLWLDSDGVSLNGVLAGSIHFGIIGRVVNVNVPDELKEWEGETTPLRPYEYTFHS